MAVPNIVADFNTTLALKVAVSATSATLSSVTDDDGDALPNGYYGFTIDRKNSSKEYIVCTLTGTALTAISTIDRGTGVATSGFARAHRKGAEVIISDFVAIKRLQDVFETGYPSATTPTTDYQLATKKYVDDLALGGATTVDRLTIVATCGEDVVAGNLLYLKLSDSKWWKADADVVTTIDNVLLGIAQGTGTTNGAISGGVLIHGVDANQSGLTANTLAYASNTAGGISSTSGTITRVIGECKSTTSVIFDPNFLKAYKNYAVDSVGTDSYAITVQSAFGALYEGMEVTFKAGTANTGAATLAVNGLTAKSIVKDVSTALSTGDILANQIVKVVYDGTNFQMTSRTSPAAIPTVTKFIPVKLTTNSSTQFDITNPAGTTFRYTWDGGGTDPGITTVTVPTGARIWTFGVNFSVANNGAYTVTGSGANYFEVTNASGVVESNKTLSDAGFLYVLQSTTTWTKSATLKYAVVEVCGGGGGAVGEDDSDSGSQKGTPSGGAGGYSRKLIAAATLGSTETVTIGAGGNPGQPGGNAGTAGATTSFGSHATATGGGAGDISASTIGGGLGASGDLNARGQGGGQESAPGGNSYFGGGGAVALAADTNGGDGSLGGGGGGATSSSTPSGWGGHGGPGLCIITEYNF